MPNSYLDRQARERIGQSGRNSEKRTGKRLDLKPTIASGSTDRERADLKNNEFLVEAKSTSQDSLGLKYEWLKGVADEAAMQGKDCALTVTFVDPQGRPKKTGTWVLIEERLFQEVMGAVRE